MNGWTQDILSRERAARICCCGRGVWRSGEGLMSSAGITWRLHWGGGLAFQQTHVAVIRRPQCLAVCRSEALVPGHVHLSTGLSECPHDMATGNWSETEQGWSHVLCRTRPRKLNTVGSALCCWPHRPTLIRRGRGRYKGANIRDYLGHLCCQLCHCIGAACGFLGGE